MICLSRSNVISLSSRRPFISFYFNPSYACTDASRTILQPSTAVMPSSSSSVRFIIRKPFTALQNDTWLHERPKEDVFQLLSDTFRMRREDKYKFEQFVQEGSVYAGASPAKELNNFRAFLQHATNLDFQRPNNKRLFPDWWSSEEIERCIMMATTNADAMVGYAVEKHDIQDFYKQNDMPMQLRMFGEALDGTMIGGQSGSQMLQARATLERDERTG